VIVLHLIRHAQQDWNRETPDAEWPLTSLGREQAVDLAEKLVSLRPDSLWCSETLRAFQTIQPYAEHSGLRVSRHLDLGERRLAWPLPPMDEMKEHYRRGWEDLDYALPNGESNREGQTRFMDALRIIADQESREGSDRSVIVCAHGNIIALAEHAARGSFGNTSLDYCESRKLTLKPDGWHLLEVQS
jgi:broad specificity phosphatase PhoE